MIERAWLDPAGVSVVTRPAAAGVCDTSATVFQLWHSAQRPTHFGVVHPHSEQRYVEWVRAMRGTLPAGTDMGGRGRSSTVTNVCRSSYKGPELATCLMHIS